MRVGTLVVAHLVVCCVRLKTALMEPNVAALNLRLLDHRRGGSDRDIMLIGTLVL